VPVVKDYIPLLHAIHRSSNHRTKICFALKVVFVQRAQWRNGNRSGAEKGNRAERRRIKKGIAAQESEIASKSHYSFISESLEQFKE
jgi:hypothetical protein